MVLFLLIAAAAALLAAGVVTANLLLTYLSLGVAAVALVLVVGNIVLRHRAKAAEDTTADTEDAEDTVDTEDAANGQDATDPEPVEVADAADPESTVEPAGEVAVNEEEDVTKSGEESDIVLVIPGRKRFHQPHCRLLHARETEELTQDEALEEGFTPCTSCSARTPVSLSTRTSPAA